MMLWPEGQAPHREACSGQRAPSLQAYTAPGLRGAVIVCPGGGYVCKAPHEGEPIARMLQQAGISAFVLDYRVHPCPHDAPLGDALRAVRVVRGMGYAQVGILGFSAGGHLACSAALLSTPGDPAADDPVERLSSRPDALISCYSVVTMRAPAAHAGSRCALLGGDCPPEALVHRYSLEEQVTPDAPPAFIWHTAEDASVPVENSLALAAAYSRCRVPFALHIFPEGRHGLGLAREIPQTGAWAALCVQWLTDRGFA